MDPQRNMLLPPTACVTSGSINPSDFYFIFWKKRTNGSLMGFQELNEIIGKKHLASSVSLIHISALSLSR